MLEQVSLRFSSRNRGAPLTPAVVSGHLPAALVAQLDGAWPAAYFVDAAAASRIAPAAAPAAAQPRAVAPVAAPAAYAPPAAKA